MDLLQLAKQLGARHYIDSQAQDPAEELIKLGGAKVVLATATSGKASYVLSKRIAKTWLS